jgi:hypothetical protein
MNKEDIMQDIRSYCFGKGNLFIKNYKEELCFINKCNKYMNINETSNTGKLSEIYAKIILEKNKIKFKEQPIIKYGTDKRFIKPDFYLEDQNLFIEIKSRSYFMSGTISEKIDNIPRKYHKLNETLSYKNSKILIVFSGGELLQDSTVELLNNSNEYVKDFKILSHKYNVLDWISIEELHNYIN